MKIDSFEKYKEIIDMIIKVKYKTSDIKGVCNKLNDFGVTDAPKYDKKGSFSCYQVFRNIYNNFRIFGVAAVFDLRTLKIDKNNMTNREEWNKKRREIRESLTPEQKDDLIDVYEQILEIDSNDDRFKRIYEIYKKEKEKDFSISNENLCYLFDIKHSKYEKARPICDIIFSSGVTLL